MLPAILLIFLYSSTADADRDNANCPCQIYVDENDTQIADCYRKDLTTIPDCVTNSTQVLDLSWNRLLYNPGQFQRFRNLEELFLHKNLVFAAHIDSFQFLFRLEILNLEQIDYTYLNAETFRDQSGLRELSLDGKLNFIESLFDHLGNLRRLNFGNSYTRVIHLPNWSFAKLPLLQKLHIFGPKTLLLRKYTFFGLSALKYLKLDQWFGKDYPPHEVFKPLISLEEIHLEELCSTKYFMFDCTTIDSRLQHVPSLKRLYFDSKMISHLGKGLSALKHLEELHLVRKVRGTCEIENLNKGTFINLKDSVLKKLVISICNINGIWPDWIEPFTKLTEISLSTSTSNFGNFWANISDSLRKTSLHSVRFSLTSANIYERLMIFYLNFDFDVIPLTDLEITDAKFFALYDTTTKLPKSLKYLKLSHNYFSIFDVKVLRHLVNLETLDLSNQQILHINGQNALEWCSRSEMVTQHSPLPISVKTNTDQGIIGLRDFNLTRTKCLSLPFRLKYLDLSKSELLCGMLDVFCDSNNSLKVLKASEQRHTNCFKSGTFWFVLRSLGQIEELDLNGNLITEIPKGAFFGLSKLKKLLLYKNKLHQLSFVINNLISLETLDLSANNIAYVSRGAFSGLYNLKKVLLNSNKLIGLSFYVNNLVSLETLDLSDNIVEYASNSFTSQIDDLPLKTNLTLYLSYNRMICNCKHLDFVAWLIVTQVISNKNELNCTFENETQISIGRLSHPYHILKYKCTRNDITIGCTVTFWGLNILLGCLAYILHNRLKLRYLVAFGRRTLNPYHPIEDHDIEMEYDVYISYEGDFHVTRDVTLRDFVIYTVLPELERRGVKVMIREELDPGRNLYEVITNTVRHSKKVIAFLTNGYCSDMWNVFEFNQAVMEGIYTNRQVTIPVLFESLRQDKVKEEICAFLLMEPVPKYSPDLSDNAFTDFLYERIRDTRKFG